MELLQIQNTFSEVAADTGQNCRSSCRYMMGLMLSSIQSAAVTSAYYEHLLINIKRARLSNDDVKCLSLYIGSK